jgi:hypothetical protein
MHPFDPIIDQLKSQNIDYEILQDNYSPTNSELDKVVRAWKKKFIGSKTAPYLNKYLWHIFSYKATQSKEGIDAKNELNKQFDSETLIFNETQQYLIRCVNKIPKIEMDDFIDDIYVSHHNFKWTFVIPHEVQSGMGPYFSYGDK